MSILISAKFVHCVLFFCSAFFYKAIKMQKHEVEFYTVGGYFLLCSSYLYENKKYSESEWGRVKEK